MGRKVLVLLSEEQLISRLYSTSESFKETPDVLLLSKATNCVSSVPSSIPSSFWGSDWLLISKKKSEPKEKEPIEGTSPLFGVM